MKHLFEVRAFGGGVVTAESSSDLPPGYAQDLLNVDPDMPYGALHGILEPSTISSSSDWESFGFITLNDGTTDMLKIDTSGDATWYSDYYTNGVTSTESISGTATGFSGGAITPFLSGFFVGLGSSNEPVWIGRPGKQFGIDNSGTVYSEPSNLIVGNEEYSADKIVEIDEAGTKYILAITEGHRKIRKFKYEYEDGVGGHFTLEQVYDHDFDPIVSIAKGLDDSIYILCRSNDKSYVYLLNDELAIETGACLSITMGNNTEATDIGVTENKIWISYYRKPEYNSSGALVNCFKDTTTSYDNYVGNFNITSLSSAIPYVNVATRTPRYYTVATDSVGYLHDGGGACQDCVALPRKAFVPISDNHIGVIVEFSSDYSPTRATLRYSSGNDKDIENTVVIIGENYDETTTPYADTTADGGATKADIVNFDDVPISTIALSQLTGSYTYDTRQFFLSTSFSNGKPDGVYLFAVTKISAADGIMASSGFGISNLDDQTYDTVTLGFYPWDSSPFFSLYIGSGETTYITMMFLHASGGSGTFSGSYNTSTETIGLASLDYIPMISIGVSNAYNKVYSGTYTANSAGELHGVSTQFTEYVKIGDIAATINTRTGAFMDSGAVTDIASDTVLTIDNDSVFNNAGNLMFSIYRSSSNFDRTKSYFWAWSLVYDGAQQGPLSQFVAQNKLESGYGIDKQVFVYINTESPKFSKRITGINLYRAEGTSTTDIVPETQFRYIGHIDVTEPMNSAGGNKTGDKNIMLSVFTDDGTPSASYESLTGVLESVEHMNLNYTISTVVNSMAIYGGCDIKDLDDANRYIFRSAVGKYNQINWVDHNALLPETPVAMIGSGNRLLVFDTKRAFVVEPVNMVIEASLQSVGVEGRTCVAESPMGSLVASNDIIYLVVNGSFSPISTAIGNLYKSRDRSVIPVVYYDQSKNGFGISILTSDDEYRILFFSLDTKSWWIFDDSGAFYATGSKSEVYYVDNSSNMKLMHGSATYRDFNWTSPKMYPNNGTGLKKFYNVKLGLDNSLGIGTFTVITDGSTETYESSYDGEIRDLEFKSGWSPYIKFVIENHPGDNPIDHIGVLYREKVVKS